MVCTGIWTNNSVWECRWVQVKTHGQGHWEGPFLTSCSLMLITETSGWVWWSRWGRLEGNWEMFKAAQLQEQDRQQTAMELEGHSSWCARNAYKCMPASGQRCTVYSSLQGSCSQEKTREKWPQSGGRLPFTRYTAHNVHRAHPEQSPIQTLSPQIWVTTHTHTLYTL